MSSSDGSLVSEYRSIGLTPSPLSWESTCGAHSLFLTRKGFLYGCGQNRFGQVGCEPGHGTGPNKLVPQPVPIALGDEGVHITFCEAAAHASGAVSASGSVFTWGDAVEGQLGHPRGGEDPTFHHFSAVMRTAVQSTPREVALPPGSYGAQLALGGGIRLTKGAGHAKGSRDAQGKRLAQGQRGQG